MYVFLYLLHSMQPKSGEQNNRRQTGFCQVFSCGCIAYNVTFVLFVAVSILLAMSVYQVIIGDKLPSNFNTIPIIGQS